MAKKNEEIIRVNTPYQLAATKLDIAIIDGMPDPHATDRINVNALNIAHMLRFLFLLFLNTILKHATVNI